MNKIKKALVEGRLIYRIFRKEWLLVRGPVSFIAKLPGRAVGFIDRRISSRYRNKWAGKLPVKKNRVVFMTFNDSYSCNPKYICEELRRRGNYDIIFISTKGIMKKKDAFPKDIKVFERYSVDAYKAMATAGFWIENAIGFYFYDGIDKKPEQTYINTWHGSLGFKKIGRDNVPSKRWGKAALKSGANTDYIISNSEFENGVYRETHWPAAEIKMLGHARNDILFEKDKTKLNAINRRVRRQLYIEPEQKICLYAPTFRDNGDVSCYDIDYPRLKKALEEKFGGEFVIISRMHHKNRRLASESPYDYVIDGTMYPDMQELMAVSDVGISDYSSWLLDFLMTERPAFIFATDIKEYEGGRGLYYPLESAPFPIGRDNKELLSVIKGFDEEKFKADKEAFLKDKGCMEDGHAAERIADFMDEIIASK